jgi:beta-lactamase class A
MTVNRRDALLTCVASLLAGPAPAAEPASAALADLEKRGGRLGVFALDCASGRSLAWRADERFLMCSTWKTLAAAAVLQKVDAGRERLDRWVAYSKADLVGNAPATRAQVAEGGLSINALCQAMIELSDNTAANLLLDSLGGPVALTRFVRSCGDRVTRVDRREPDANVPSGELDTTTPRAMAGFVKTVLLGDVLRPASRTRLEGWMATAKPGLHRLRAAVPAGWAAADKSGTGDTQTNDVAIFRPPRRAPLIVAAYYDCSVGDLTARESVLREAGGLVSAWTQGRP